MDTRHLMLTDADAGEQEPEVEEDADAEVIDPDVDAGDTDIDRYLRWALVRGCGTSGTLLK